MLRSGALEGLLGELGALAQGGLSFLQHEVNLVKDLGTWGQERSPAT